MEIHLLGQTCTILPENPNREWLYRDGDREKRSIVRWPGRPPGGFSRAYAVLLARLNRSRELELSQLVAAVWVLEGCLEFYRLEYPITFIRALVHALPACQAAQIARQTVRIFQAHLRAMGRQGQGKPWNGRQYDKQSWQEWQSWDSHGSGSGGDHRRSRDRESRGPRRRRRESSDSDSEANQETREVGKAKRLLLDKCSDFRAWHQEQQEKKETEQLKKQGMVLATVLNEKLDSLIAARPPSFPAQPPGGEGAGASSGSGPAGSPEQFAAMMVKAFKEQLKADGHSPGSAAVDSPGEELTQCQAGYLKAVICPPGSKRDVKFTSNKKEELKEIVAKRLKDAAAVKHVAEFWKANMGTQSIPKDLKKRACVLVDFFGTQ